jgi:hypothetical protein
MPRPEPTNQDLKLYHLPPSTPQHREVFVCDLLNRDAKKYPFVNTGKRVYVPAVCPSFDHSMRNISECIWSATHGPGVAADRDARAARRYWTRLRKLNRRWAKRILYKEMAERRESEGVLRLYLADGTPVRVWHIDDCAVKGCTAGIYTCPHPGRRVLIQKVPADAPRASAEL